MRRTVLPLLAARSAGEVIPEGVQGVAREFSGTLPGGGESSSEEPAATGCADSAL